MKVIFLIIPLFLLCSCLRKEVERNLKDWQGEWLITGVGKDGGEGGVMNEFLDQPWKKAEMIVEDFGYIKIDENGSGEFYVKNREMTDTLLPIKASFYLIQYGQAHVEFMGLKIIESSDPGMNVGDEICNNGDLVFWLRDRAGNKRVLQLDNLPDCGFTMNGAQWFFIEKQ